MDFAGSSIVTSEPVWWRMSLVGEVVHVGAGVILSWPKSSFRFFHKMLWKKKKRKNFLANPIYGNSLYLPLSFSAVNLKLLQKLALKKIKKKANSLVTDARTESVDNTLKKKEDEQNKFCSSTLLHWSCLFCYAKIVEYLHLPAPSTPHAICTELFVFENISSVCPFQKEIFIE